MDPSIKVHEDRCREKYLRDKPKFPCDKCQKVFGNEDKINFHIKLCKSNYWVKDVESSQHGKTFYKGILHFNSYIIGS